MDLYYLAPGGEVFVVPNAPSGYVRSDSAVQIDPPPGIGFIYRSGKWVKAPPTPTVPNPPVTYKADVWRRATDAQAAVIDTELQKLDVRRRRMWDDAMYLDHADELVVFFRTMLSQTFGAAEADRILAPSNV